MNSHRMNSTHVSWLPVECFAEEEVVKYNDEDRGLNKYVDDEGLQ